MGNLSSKRGEATPHTTPTGLYEHCEWDPKVVRRLIHERKLAPISVGKEEAEHEGLEECPICFLYYAGGLNRSRCCRKGACTECYLQVKRPNQNTTCPFCNHDQYIVTFSGPLSREEIAQEAHEQMKVLELKISMRKDEIERDRQRELEKERRLKERETSGDLGPSSSLPSTTSTSSSISSSTSASVPSSRQTSHPDSAVRTASVPSHSAQPSLANYSQSFYGSSYPPPATGNQHGFGGDMSNLTDPDLDDLMLMEAIRLSLLDVQNEGNQHQDYPQPSQTTNAHETLPNDSNSDDDFDHTDGAEYNSSTTSATIPTTHSTTSTTSTSTHTTNPIPISPPRSPCSSTPPSPRSPPTPPPTITTTTTTTTNTSECDQSPSPSPTPTASTKNNDPVIDVDGETSSTLTASHSDNDNDTDSDDDTIINSTFPSLPINTSSLNALDRSTPILNNPHNNNNINNNDDGGEDNCTTTTSTPNVNDFEPPGADNT